MCRWVANRPGHPINNVPSIKRAWRPHFTDANPAVWTIQRAIDDCVAFAEAEADGPGTYIGYVMPQNICQQLPFPRLLGQVGDKPAAGPWTPFGDNNLWSNVGVSANEASGKVAEFFDGLADALAALNLPNPRWLHLDVEEDIFSAGGWGAAFLSGARSGFYTPDLADPRSATEDVDGRGNTLAMIDAARVAAGVFTYNDDAGVYDEASGNVYFNFDFCLSLGNRSWALERAIFRHWRRAFPASRVANYDDYNASNRALHCPWNGRTGVGQGRQFIYGDAHAPVLYPPNLSAPTIQLPGETHAELYLRCTRLKFAAIDGGTQATLPRFPWVLEAGMSHEGLTITPEIMAAQLNAAWDGGAFEYFGWSDDNADPFADQVLEAWNLHLAYVAAHL